ncbi:uncharacterized protein CPUR_08123 [Claviceps purpurea 20.1]|uniref:Uncharacterized protein n=1 Tax=Claviceps purpurea (strain 20.1) TaxID=1111077 RepID=M1W5M9_CLAP2|nr:uncharacterized protein CPUR_08123 [Claviceps purpurea 20.1]
MRGPQQTWTSTFWAGRILQGLTTYHSSSQGNGNPARPDEKRFCWGKMDKEFVGAEARSRFQTATTPIRSPQDLDTYADWIVDELTNIATLAVPKKPHGRPRQQPWWNDKVQSAVRAARRV